MTSHAVAWKLGCTRVRPMLCTLLSLNCRHASRLGHFPACGIHAVHFTRYNLWSGHNNKTMQHVHTNTTTHFYKIILQSLDAGKAQTNCKKKKISTTKNGSTLFSNIVRFSLWGSPMWASLPRLPAPNAVWEYFVTIVGLRALPPCLPKIGIWEQSFLLKTYAGRRTDFRDKNRELFSGELFSGEELLPENRFLGQ